jgi:hypothetical protein
VGRGFLAQGDRQRVEYPPGWQDKLGELYRDGNRQLIERYGVALHEHGYAV